MKKLFLSLLVFQSALLFSQEALKSTEEEYYDFLNLSGIAEKPTLNYRTLSDSEWKIKNFESEENENSDSEKKYFHPWQNLNLGSKKTLFESQKETKSWFVKGINRSVKLKIYGPEWFNSVNTCQPYGQNDGALWQGKGYNTSLTTGIRLEAFGFEATIKPQITFSQNLDFDHLPGKYASPYSYFYTEGGGIDLVQRFGDKPYWTFDWGDTELRWTIYNFTFGFGTQSPWIGPAYLNPMLGSNNAATYPKFDIGLRKTKIIIPGIKWHFGDIEARLWTGYLSESDYFDEDSSNDHNMLNALSISFAPSFIPGLTVGVNRIFLTKWKAKNLKYLGRLFTLNDENSQDEGEDGKLTFSFNWRFPKIGFEAYGELGKDDYSKFPQNPLHTVIYTLGLKQVIPIVKNKVSSEIIFEWNNFEMTQDFQTQWQYKGWFSHGKILQGYTNKGQPLAGGSGTFGNSQYLAYKVYYPKGSSTLLIHRYTPDDNYVSNQAVYTSATTNNEKWHDAWKCYVVVGGESTYFITKSFYLSGAFKYMKIYNYDYDKTKDNIDNFYIQLSAKYNF